MPAGQTRNIGEGTESSVKQDREAEKPDARVQGTQEENESTGGKDVWQDGWNDGGRQESSNSSTCVKACSMAAIWELTSQGFIACKQN